MCVCICIYIYIYIGMVGVPSGADDRSRSFMVCVRARGKKNHSFEPLPGNPSAETALRSLIFGALRAHPPRESFLFGDVVCFSRDGTGVCKKKTPEKKAFGKSSFRSSKSGGA